MALFAASKLLSLPNLTAKQMESLASEEMAKILQSFVRAANALIGDFVPLNDAMISYASSLTATSVVLESIDAFLNSVQSMPKMSHFVDTFQSFNDRQFVQK